MPEPLNDKERQVLDLLITQAGGVNRPVRFGDLRKARFPELVADIYQAHTDYLDSLADCVAIFREAEAAGVPLFSSSSLRFGKTSQEARDPASSSMCSP